MRLSTRAGIGSLATALVIVLVAGSAAAEPAPGAPGVGDPYYPGAGNGGYDVEHYDIRVGYQPSTERLTGTTTILATATQELSSFNLDFGLHVDSVLVGNVPATFAPDADDPSELVVTPRRPLADGAPMTVVVKYADTPSKVTIDGYQGWHRTPTGALAVDEPTSAEWWYPSNDHPTDKATFDVSAEVPDDVAAISNGTLARKSQNRPGWTRWSWRSTQPQATYLTFLAVGRFDVTDATTPDGKPFVTAYDPALGGSLGAAKASVGRTPEVVDFLAGRFGDYPFEAQGGVVSEGLGFALETQTRPVYDNEFFANGANTSVVVHENAHQWFGDSVALGAWSDIWLNEAFATYAEYLWSEAQGEGTADELARYVYDSHPAGDEFWQVLPGDPGAENQFDDAVYDRGALAAHALRKAMGDDAFFELLHTWAAEHRGGHARTRQFVDLAERIAGRQLDSVFDTWLFTAGKPKQGPNGAAGESAGSAATAATAATAQPPASYPELRRTHRLLAAAHRH